MKKVKKEPAGSEKNCLVTRKDLPLSCPTNTMELWNGHPKVYLPIEESGSEKCPYCGTQFVLQDD